MSKKWDWLLFFLILAIGSISLLVIFSIDKNLVINQLVFWGIGLLALYFIASFDYQNWQRLSTPFYLATQVALLLLIFIGDPVRGSVRWIDLGAFRFQPSEIAKIASIFVLATFYQNRSAANLKNLILSFLLIVPAFFLVLIQPDIGNSLAFIAIWFGISLVCGFRPKHIATAILLVIISSFFIFHILAPYQRQRIKSFINPTADPLGSGYQIIQSKTTVGSGQLLGRGLIASSQSSLKFLPEAESDFIFASTSEQLGFVGASLLIILYSLLIFRLASSITYMGRFAQLLITGAISYFFIQFLVNIGMNLALVPVTGITLPLVSYGGSSLISTLFLLGTVFSIKKLT